MDHDEERQGLSRLRDLEDALYEHCADVLTALALEPSEAARAMAELFKRVVRDRSHEHESPIFAQATGAQREELDRRSAESMATFWRRCDELALAILTADGRPAVAVENRDAALDAAVALTRSDS